MLRSLKIAKKSQKPRFLFSGSFMVINIGALGKLVSNPLGLGLIKLPKKIQKFAHN